MNEPTPTGQTGQQPSRTPTPPKRLAKTTTGQPARHRAIRVTDHRWEHYQRTAADHSLTLARWLTELADAASNYQPPAQD